MTEMLQFVQQADRAFWDWGVYHIWFYAAVLLIILLEKSPVTKRTVGIYPVCFLLALYNPLVYIIVKKYTTGAPGYFARLYSMIPLPVTLALGSVLLIDRLCSARVRRSAGGDAPREEKPENRRIRTALKMILTGCCCGVMMIWGTPIYQETWFVSAKNPEKLPADTVAICRILHQDGGVTVAVPGTLTTYIRQTDAGIYMPYGRNMNDLGKALSEDEPDPVYVMEEAGREGCDYIVVAKSEMNLTDFSSCGWEPYAEQGRYLIYKVEGVARKVNRYNGSRQLVEQTVLDAENNPAECEAGYHTAVYEYDRKGYLQNEYYYDLQGELIGMTGRKEGPDHDLLRFHHSTCGVREGRGSMTFTTSKRGNRFNMIHFQLYTADKMEYLLSFGPGSAAGGVTGEYLHELPDGLYYLRMKANTNSADEYIESLVYLEKGDRIAFSYYIDELDEEQISVRDLSVNFV